MLEHSPRQYQEPRFGRRRTATKRVRLEKKPVEEQQKQPALEARALAPAPIESLDLFSAPYEPITSDALDLFGEAPQLANTLFDLFAETEAVVPPIASLTETSSLTEGSSEAPIVPAPPQTRLRFDDMQRMMATHQRIIEQKVSAQVSQAVQKAEIEQRTLSIAKEQGRVFYVEHKIVVNGKVHKCMVPMIMDEKGPRVMPGYKDGFGGTIFSKQDSLSQQSLELTPEIASTTPGETPTETNQNKPPGPAIADGQVMDMAQFAAAFGAAAANQVQGVACADGCGGAGHGISSANNGAFYGDVPAGVSIMRFFQEKKKHNHLHKCPRCGAPGHFDEGSTCKKCKLKIPKLAKAA